MANRCHSTLTVSGPENHLEAFRDLAQGRTPEQTLSLDSLRPTPAGLEGPARSDWRIENWGTSGDPFSAHREDDRRGELTYRFTTPSSPLNQAFMGHLARQFPLLSFHLQYEEPMMAYEGHISASGGDIISAENHRFDFYERYTTCPS